jgi:hypothetical protein
MTQERHSSGSLGHNRWETHPLSGIMNRCPEIKGVVRRQRLSVHKRASEFVKWLV